MMNWLNDDEALKKRVKEGLRNLSIDIENPDNKQLVFEQYKLIVDSSQKLEERRKDSNNIFLTINSVALPMLIQYYKLKTLDFQSLLFFAMLIVPCILICIDWLKIINSFRSLNYINYGMIRAFEEQLPTRVFSLREEMTIKKNTPSRGNMILEQETLIPRLFILAYCIYFVATLYFIAVAPPV